MHTAITTSNTETNRLNVYDSIRGFSMFLVVLGHVLLFMDLGIDRTPLSTFIITFRMPLFFFISGFFAFKPLARWTDKALSSILSRKVKAQIICTLVFYTIFALYSGNDPFGWLHYGFRGYWFTIVLFQIFVMYVISVLIARLFRSEKIVWIIICSAAAALAVQSIFHPAEYSGHPRVLSWLNLSRYTQFFVFGLIARQFSGTFNAVIANNYARAIIITLFISLLLSMHTLNAGRPSFLKFIITEIPVRYCGLLCVLILFTSKTDYFDTTAYPARILRFIGRRTLDIYMLHYFFLPHLQWLGKYISEPSMTAVQILISATIAIVIVAICLAFSNLIRSSDFLSQWLFGSKPHKKS